MKFEILNNGEGDLNFKGYKLVSSSTRMFDNDLYNHLVAERGYNFVDRQFDRFYDGFEPICKGEDGEIYTVLFVYDDDEKKPFIWQKVKRIS